MIVEFMTAGYLSCTIYLFVIGLANAFAVYDLKNDQLNPVEAAIDLNGTVKSEQICLITVALLTLLSGSYFLFLFTLPISGVSAYLYYKNLHTIDPTEIFKHEKLDFTWKLWVFKGVAYFVLLMWAMVDFMVYAFVPGILYLVKNS